MNARKTVVALLTVVAVIAVVLALNLVVKLADTRAGLQVIDVSDPANPAILGFVDTPGGAAGVAVSGTVAYVADTSSGL